MQPAYYSWNMQESSNFCYHLPLSDCITTLICMHTTSQILWSAQARWPHTRDFMKISVLQCNKKCYTKCVNAHLSEVPHIDLHIVSTVDHGQQPRLRVLELRHGFRFIEPCPFTVYFAANIYILFLGLHIQSKEKCGDCHCNTHELLSTHMEAR